MSLFVCCTHTLQANDDLLKLFHLAVEHKDLKLMHEILEALLHSENSNKDLLDALAKYSEKGKIDFALHNAIKDNNLLSSVVLVPHTKNINSRKIEHETVWITLNSGNFRPQKTPIELSLEANMIGLIPYLLMKNADPYQMRKINFFYEGEENLDYLQEFDCKIEKKICAKSKKVFFHINSPINMSRSLRGDVIAKNRLDVVEILQKSGKIDWNKACCTIIGVNYTPLQFALVIKRYEIAQFLIDHGVRIE